MRSTHNKILFLAVSFATGAYLVLTFLAVVEDEGMYQVVSNAVVAVIFAGLTLAEWTRPRRHQEPSHPMTWGEAQAEQKKQFPPRGM